MILDGSNVDDTIDYRPGRKAAMKYNIRSPLIEAGLSKKEVTGIFKATRPFNMGQAFFSLSFFKDSIRPEDNKGGINKGRKGRRLPQIPWIP